MAAKACARWPCMKPSQLARPSKGARAASAAIRTCHVCDSTSAATLPTTGASAVGAGASGAPAHAGRPAVTSARRREFRRRYPSQNSLLPAADTHTASGFFVSWLLALA